MEEIDIPQEVIQNIVKKMVEIRPTFKERLINLKMSDFCQIVEPWIQDSLKDRFNFIKVNNCIVYMSGTGVDKQWHVDHIAYHFGRNFINVAVPLYIEKQAGLQIVDDEKVDNCKHFLKAEPIENSDNILLTTLNENGTSVIETFSTKSGFMKVGKAYMFDGGRPHRTIPGGIRITFMFGISTKPVVKNIGFINMPINFDQREYYDDLAETMHDMFNNSSECSVEDAIKGWNTYFEERDLNKYKDEHVLAWELVSLYLKNLYGIK